MSVRSTPTTVPHTACDISQLGLAALMRAKRNNGAYRSSLHQITHSIDDNAELGNTYQGPNFYNPDAQAILQSAGRVLDMEDAVTYYNKLRELQQVLELYRSSKQKAQRNGLDSPDVVEAEATLSVLNNMVRTWDTSIPETRDQNGNVYISRTDPYLGNVPEHIIQRINRAKDPPVVKRQRDPVDFRDVSPEMLQRRPVSDGGPFFQAIHTMGQPGGFGNLRQRTNRNSTGGGGGYGGGYGGGAGGGRYSGGGDRYPRL